MTIQNVRFSTLKVTVQENRTAKIEMTGTARNFNASQLNQVPLRQIRI